MRPVRAGDHVAGFERAADAHGNAFLSLVLVDRAGHDAFQEQVLDALLELADQEHLAIKRQEEVLFVCHSRSPLDVGWNQAGSLRPALRGAVRAWPTAEGQCWFLALDKEGY